jgi:hypothetical protein
MLENYEIIKKKHESMLAALFHFPTNPTVSMIATSRGETVPTSDNRDSSN